MSSSNKKPMFLAPTFVEHEVNGNSCHFYPVSVKTLYTVKQLGKPIAKALTILFASKGNDTNTVQREFSNTEGSAGGKEVAIEAISVELAKHRTAEQVEAVEYLVDAFTDQANAQVIGRLIMDSMRDEFPRDFNNDDVCEFMDDPDLDAATLGQLLIGVSKANARIFGPFGEKALAKVNLAFHERINAEAKDEPEPERKEEASPEDTETSKTSSTTTDTGSSSRTPSSTSAPEPDSPSNESST